MVLFCDDYINMVFNTKEKPEDAKKFLLAELEHKRGQLRPEQYTEIKERIKNR